MGAGIGGGGSRSAAAAEATERDDVKAVVVYGGERVFAAGADVVACLKLIERDLKAAARADVLILKAGAEPAVEIALKPAEA